MKKACAFVLAALLLLSLTAGAFASGEASGGASGETAVSLTAGDWKFSRVKDGDGYSVTVTQFSGDPDENGLVIVPKILGGGTVTAIGMTAFRNTAIQAILLPDSVETVETWAFYDCTSLRYVTSANAAVDVDAAAFQNSPASVTGEGTAVTVALTPPEAEGGFQLLALGEYVLPDGFALSPLREQQAVLRADAKGTVTFSGTTWTVAGYDGSAVDSDADEPAPLMVYGMLTEIFGLEAEELNMTFRALSAKEAAALNAAVEEGPFSAYASRLRFEEGFYLNGGKVAVDPQLECFDAATGERIAGPTSNLKALYDNPLLDALGAKQGAEPYSYVAWRDIDGDGDIDVLFYADTALPSSSATVTLSGKLAYPGISGGEYSELLAGKVGRPVLDGSYLTFENAAIEARGGDTVQLAYTAPSTENDSVLGAVNEERSILWADGDSLFTVRELHGVSTSQGNWTKIRDENNSYAGQPMEVIMQWGMGAALYASQGGVMKVGDSDGARSDVYTCGDGANGVLATGVLDADRPSQIYVYNTDFTLEGWNNHVVDTIYGGYVYLEDVTGVTGRRGSYIMNNGSTLANDFGDGTVEVRGFTGEAWGDSSAGCYLIGNGSLVAKDSSLTSHLNAAVKDLGGAVICTDTDLAGMQIYSGQGSTATFDGGTWTLFRDYAGDGYVYGKAAAETAQLWYDITGGTTLLSYVMSGVGNTYADLYAEYAEEIDAWGGKDAFYAAVNDIADRYGYGAAYHAADDAPLRNSMFDNTYYAIMRNGFQYQPVDGKYSLDALADFSDVPYLGASNLKSIPVAFFDASGSVDVRNVSFVYDDSIGADYRFFSVGKGTVDLADCEGASGIITAGTVNFSGTDFTGSFAAGNDGLWDGESGYIDGTGEYTFRNGNYSGADAAGAAASFTDGSVWTVTHDSWLASLTIGADASVQAADGQPLTMTVDGVPTPIVPGTYEGEIVVWMS